VTVANRVTNSISKVLIAAPLEAKVASSGFIGLVATGIIESIQYFAPHLTVPSPALTGLYVTIVSTIAGYFAPHTSTTEVQPPANPPANPPAV
jgi:hypothetical protein